MSAKCNYEKVPEFLGNRNSLLHKQLKELYPEDLDADGNSIHYINIREDDNFKKWLNEDLDWSDETAHQELLKLPYYANIFNYQGEPKLYIDHLNNKFYFLNFAGDVKEVKPNMFSVTAEEISSMTNTLTGNFINQDKENIKPVELYVPEQINLIINKIEEVLEQDKANPNKENKLSLAQKVKLTQSKARLERILNTPVVLNRLIERVKLRLKEYNLVVSIDYKNEDKNLTALDQKEEEPENHDDIYNFILDANEKSNRATDDPEILKFIASVPKYKEFVGDKENYDIDPTKQERVYDGVLNMPKYLSQAEVWDLLESLLSDVLPEGNETFFDAYLRVLSTHAELTKMPELSYIVNYLRNVADENFRIKFFTAFFKGRQEYVITQITNDVKDDKLTIKIINPADVNSKEGKYAMQFLSSLELINLASLQSAKSKAVKAFDKINKKSTDPEPYIKLLEELLITDLKLKLHPKTIRYLVNSFMQRGPDYIEALIADLLTTKMQVTTNPASNSSTLFFGYLTMATTWKESKNKKAREVLYNKLISNDSFFRHLAKAEKVFSRDLSEATLLVGGSQRWQYSLMSSLRYEILQWKQGNTEALQKAASLHGGALLMAEYLMQPGALGLIEVYLNTEIKKQQDNQPMLHKKITTIDLHVDIFAKMFNSLDEFYANQIKNTQGVGKAVVEDAIKIKNYITYNFGADKNSLYGISGLPVFTANMSKLYDYTNKEIGADFKFIIENYLKGEITRAIDASNLILKYISESDPKEKQRILLEELIPGYHYRVVNKNKNIEDINQELDENDFLAGDYWKLGIFSKDIIEFINEEAVNKAIFFLESGRVNPAILTSSILNNKLLPRIYARINELIQKERDALSSIIIRSEESETTGDIKEKTMFEIEYNITFTTPEHAVINYIINSFINNYELSNILNGHVGFYKQSKNNPVLNLDDFFKRASVLGSTGKYLYNNKENKEKTYIDFFGNTRVAGNTQDATIVAVIEDIEADTSEFKDLINEGIKLNSNSRKLNYNYTLTDGQGVITPKHFKEIVTRIYGWTVEDERIFNELNNRDTVITQEHIDWITRYSKVYTPLKLVHFELYKNYIPVYFKYSVAVLFPAITNNTKADVILKQMEKQNIDQVIFKSGSKAANPGMTKIHDENNKIKDNINFNPFVINSNKLKLQTEVPTKEENLSAVGTQTMKNILANIDLNDDTKYYQLRDELLTGKEIYNRINQITKILLNEQLNNLLKSIDYDAENNNYINIRKVKLLLANQLDPETDANLIEFLKTDLPIETIPGLANKLYQILAAYIRKEAGKIYTNGNSAVQIANLGFDDLSNSNKKGIFYFDENNTKLTPPLVDPQTKTIKQAKILLPFSSLLLDASMSYEDFIKAYKEGRIDKRIFSNIIGYRIPNQAIASNDAFEVIGILPPSAGNQAIVFPEITTKTGSDFDIDKLYLMLPNYQVQENENAKKNILYIDDINTIKGLQNLLIESFVSILTASKTYDDLMSPLDDPEKRLKTTIREISMQQWNFNHPEEVPYTDAEKFYEDHKPDALEQLFPINIIAQRVNVLQAKSLIAIAANNMTDLPESQKTKFGMKYNIGFGVSSLSNIYQKGKYQKDDFKISKILSYFMNATVDAAKDSYIIEGNINTDTANAMLFLLRMGVNEREIFLILMSPVIKKYTDEKLNAKAKVASIATRYSQEQLKEYAELYLKKLGETDNNSFWEVFSEEDLLTENLSDTKTKLLIGFYYLLQESGKQMSDAVVAMKSDATGAGKTVPIHIALNNRLEKVTSQEEGLFTGVLDKWFENKNNYNPDDFLFQENYDESIKYLGALANNTLLLMNLIAPKLFLEATPYVVNIVNTIVSALGNPLEDREGNIKLILDYLYPLLLYSTGHKLYQIDETRRDYLKGIDFAKDFAKVLQETNNTFLKQFYIKDGIIQFPNFRHFSAEEKLILKAAFAELALEPKYKDFVFALVQYAFVTTGFRNTHFSFNEYIPIDFFITNFHGVAIQEAFDKMSNNSGHELFNVAEVLTLLAKNNPYNFSIVRRIPSVKRLGVNIVSNKVITSEKILSRIQTNKGTYVPFVFQNKNLYMLIALDEEGNPIYTEIEITSSKNFNIFTFETPESGLFIIPFTYNNPIKYLFEAYQDSLEDDLDLDEDEC